ncbi:hypothetical protein PQH03_25415 [Ralstonia insidiosa]|jgi:hypothetical protein|uniref:hypothetical protein n=1 Tax=Ralstonia TaxID=48736 RepID=UPI000664BB88|nr:hypothetical protein [Ralstonia insidiosa]KMW45614.1 membrane protein [Ralstonia sp. MD27]MBX3772450.1 hypothetical protein [Ralstonia pickettii]NOZ15659.1 hypothetical protein [Betaproteobacteria bacterium]MBA9857106.1 hypothetical protein [Ralstonia insidiosa]MBA9870208.1 hypothetical protein [Ralstonia insidiosa]
MNGMGTKWLAGTVLGLPLSIALCTLAILWLPGGWESGLIGALLVCLPLWAVFISVSVLFSTSVRAWAVFGTANLLSFGVLWLPRLLQT